MFACWGRSFVPVCRLQTVAANGSSHSSLPQHDSFYLPPSSTESFVPYHTTLLLPNLISVDLSCGRISAFPLPCTSLIGWLVGWNHDNAFSLHATPCTPGPSFSQLPARCFLELSRLWKAAFFQPPSALGCSPHGYGAQGGTGGEELSQEAANGPSLLLRCVLLWCCVPPCLVM